MGIKDWFTTDRPVDMGEVGRKIRVSTGLVFLRNVLGFLIKLIVGIVGVIVVVFLLLGLVIFTVRTFSTGTSDVFITKLGVTLSSFPAGQTIKGVFSKVFGGIWNPEQVLEPGMKTDVDKNTDRNLGVIFTKFTADPGRFVEETDFKAYGWVEVTPFEDESMEVDFECGVDGEECSEASYPKDVIRGGDTKSLTVSCECNAGEAKRNVDGKVVNMKAKYDFITKGYSGIYVMGSDRLESVRRAKGDVFEGIYDPKLNKKKGVVTSTYTNGPLKMAIGSYYTQPFSEGGPSDADSYYIMKIELSRKITATGFPVGMKSLKVFTPTFMEIRTDDGIFVDSGESEDGMNVYELGSGHLREVNSPCRRILFKQIEDLRDADCRKMWEKGFVPVYADFRIINVGAEDDLSQGYVIIEAKYGYEESTYDDIIVMKKPGGGVGGEDEEE